MDVLSRNCAANFSICIALTVSSWSRRPWSNTSIHCCPARAAIWICALATLAKTIGAWLFYVLGDKLEDLAVPRFGKYIGVRHEDLEHFGEHFKGTWKDAVILLILRSIPVMPSTPISLVCGILKINLRAFFVATYIGFYIRNLTFMLLGYTGLAAMGSLMEGIDTAETLFKILIVLAGVGLLGWLYWKRRSGHPARWLKMRGAAREI